MEFKYLCFYSSKDLLDIKESERNLVDGNFIRKCASRRI